MPIPSLSRLNPFLAHNNPDISDQEDSGTTGADLDCGADRDVNICTPVAGTVGFDVEAEIALDRAIENTNKRLDNWEKLTREGAPQEEIAKAEKQVHQAGRRLTKLAPYGNSTKTRYEEWAKEHPEEDAPKITRKKSKTKPATKKFEIVEFSPNGFPLFADRAPSFRTSAAETLKLPLIEDMNLKPWTYYAALGGAAAISFGLTVARAAKRVPKMTLQGACIFALGYLAEDALKFKHPWVKIN